MSARWCRPSGFTLLALVAAVGCSSSMAKSPPSTDASGAAVAAPGTPESPPRTKPGNDATSGCDLDPGEVELFRALRRRVDDLTARENTLAGRERTVAEAERRLKGEIDLRLEEVKKLEARQGIGGPPPTPRAERLRTLADTLRPLSARKAAPILANADPDLAVTLLGELGTERAGAVLAQMDPALAGRLVDRAASAGPGQRSLSSTPPDPPAESYHRPDRTGRQP
ncbi:MAG: hypothetical protein HY903_09630 [Deltaproteobacteria bacterium]|nr:hypothetical protein [Deltaproteobacteria bacterium]